MKRLYFLIAILTICISVNAQLVVTDPLNTAQGVINALNTGSTVAQTIEQVKKLQTALDYVQKVSNTVRNIRMYKDLVDRQNRLNKNCLDTLEKAQDMKLQNISQMTSSVQSVIRNNASIISLTQTILTSDLKMNDAERIEQLDNCLVQVQEQEAQLSKIRQIMSHTETISNNLKSLK